MRESLETQPNQALDKSGEPQEYEMMIYRKRGGQRNELGRERPEHDKPEVREHCKRTEGGEQPAADSSGAATW